MVNQTMIYAIRHLCHRTDIDMGRHGFTIDLHPSVPEAIAESGLTQEHVDTCLEGAGQMWLDAAGFSAVFDPDNCGARADSKLPPGPNAHPLYRPGMDLRVVWGKWGPEHISVPGNAAGLDLDRGCGCLFRRGQMLVPHNVDGLAQKYLLLIVFTELAGHVAMAASNSDLDKGS